ncbi:MAG: hypothetical protein M1401_00615 [Chloroflexi bacterium]|nr:hypothetical protein [Chloroflexota bacterium]
MQSGRRFWVIGLALLGVVVAIIVGAFVLGDSFRPKVDTVPVSTGAAASDKATPVAAPALATTKPSNLQTANSPLEREIEAAYLRYWEVRAEAFLNRDTSHLSEVMAEAELARTRQQIDDLKAQGRAARIVVEHRIAFLEVGEAKARLYDEYLNRSYLVDPQSKQAVQTPGPGGIAKVSYELKKIDGAWRVIDGMRHD